MTAPRPLQLVIPNDLGMYISWDVVVVEIQVWKIFMMGIKGQGGLTEMEGVYYPDHFLPAITTRVPQ